MELLEAASVTGIVIDALLVNEAHRATKYLSEHEVVSAQRVGRIDKRGKRTHVVVKIGAPNYAERQFIRKYKKTGESFPVKEVQIKFRPKDVKSVKQRRSR